MTNKPDPSTIETWLQANAFYCPVLHAKITPEQCKKNREKRVGGPGGGRLTNPQCASCDYKKYQDVGQVAGEKLVEYLEES